MIRATKSRWPDAIRYVNDVDATMFELCYSVSPLDGDWGLMARTMLVSSRFLLRNDSAAAAFEVKQTGSGDSTAVIVLPGQTAPFHWGDFRLPELVSVRPSVKSQGRCIYKWSGGFDPLVIGHLPLRIRKVHGVVPETSHGKDSDQFRIKAIKMDVEIRSQTGGTGINISFQEEDVTGDGALFRIENLSTFPIWFCQDDVLANPLKGNMGEDEGDFVGPLKGAVFALDIPYKQGKYSHRKAASVSVLLRVRLSLAPLSCRAGVETTKVIALATAGETIRLNPSKLMLLNADTRRALQEVRVIGVINNDGPTRVLTLRYVFCLV